MTSHDVRGPDTRPAGLLPPSVELSARARTLLDEQAPLTYVHGPAGFGAPGVVARWVQTALSDSPVAWYDVPVSVTAEEFCDGVTSTLAVALGTHVVDGESLLDLLARHDSSGILVINGGRGVPAIESSLLEDMAARTSRWRIILVADQCDAGWADRSGSTVVSPADMTLSIDEACAAFASRRTSIGREVLERLHAESAGWPAAIEAAVDAHVAGVTGEDPDPRIRAVRSSVGRTVRPFLPYAGHDLWRYLAVAVSPTPGELDELIDADAFDIVARLVAQGLVTTDTTGAAHAVVLMPALRHVLRRELRAEGPGSLRETHRELAQVRSRSGVLDCGLADAHAAEDWPLCGYILEHWWPFLAFGASLDVVYQAIAAMPTHVLMAYPTAGHCAEFLGLLPNGTVEVSMPTTEADIVDACRTDEAYLSMMRTLIAMIARRQHGNLAEARRIALQASPLVDHATRAESSPPAKITGIWTLHAGLSCVLAGDLENAHRFFRRGWQMREHDTLGSTALDLATKLAVHAALVGDAPGARRWIDDAPVSSATAHRRADWTIEFTAISLNLARLILAGDALDLPEAERLIECLDDGFVRDECWPLNVWARGRHDLSRGQARGVLALVADAEEVFQATSSSDGIHRPLLTLLRAEARMALGHGTQAANLLRDLPAESSFGRVARARLRLMAGDPVQARSVAAEYRERADTSARDRRDLCLIVACAELEMGDEVSAAAALAEGLRMARENDDLRAVAAAPRAVLETLSDRVPDAEDALRRLEAKGIEPTYPDRVDMVELSKRELVVLHQLVGGGTHEEIARELFVSVNTVKSQLKSLYAKLEVHSREDAVAEARRLGFIVSTPLP